MTGHTAYLSNLLMLLQKQTHHLMREDDERHVVVSTVLDAKVSHLPICLRTTMSKDASASTPSSPALSARSVPPSPTLSTLSLSDPKELSEQDLAEAAKLKAAANKAFVGEYCSFRKVHTSEF